MARVLSPDKRRAILDAAAQGIAEDGLAASTSSIAKLAGISTGALFLYFPTKDALLNQLYLDIKTEISQAMLMRYPKEEAPRVRLKACWMAYLEWGVKNEYKRKAMAQLSVSDRITKQTRDKSQKPLAPIYELLEECLNPATGQTVAYISALMTSLSEVTMGFIHAEKRKAKTHAEVGFETLTRAIACIDGRRLHPIMSSQSL